MIGTRWPTISGRLHRGQRSRSGQMLGRVPHHLGQQVSGDQDVVAQRLVRVRAVLGLQPGDPQGDLLDERDLGVLLAGS